jgi:hypothetical protein
MAPHPRRIQRSERRDISGARLSGKALLDDGVLSPEEFRMAKRKLLDG